jgi:S1/P1 Nuclease.
LSQQPEEWATESLLAAREAYKSLAIDKNKAASKNALGVRWEGREKYDQRCKPIVVSRLRQAAQRLSTVLNQIWS